LALKGERQGYAPPLVLSVEHSKRDRWLEVCAEAAIEEDPERLKELAREIAVLLYDERMRLRRLSPTKLRA